MSAAACKIIIDCTAALIGKLLCLSGSVTVADNASPGSVSIRFAHRFERLADQFGREVDAMIDELKAAIPEDGSPDGRTRPPSNINRGDAPPER